MRSRHSTLEACPWFSPGPRFPDINIVLTFLFAIAACSQDDAAAASLLLVDSLAARPTATSADGLASPSHRVLAPAPAPASTAPTSTPASMTPTGASSSHAATEPEALLHAALRQLPAMRTHDLLRTLRALQIAGLPASLLSPSSRLHVAFTLMHSPMETEQLLEALRLAVWVSQAHGVAPQQGQQVQKGHHGEQQVQEQQLSRGPGSGDMDLGTRGKADAEGVAAAGKAAAAKTLGAQPASSGVLGEPGNGSSGYVSSGGSGSSSPAREDDPLLLPSPACGGQLPGAYPQLVDHLVSRLAGPGGPCEACDGQGGGGDMKARADVLVSAANTLLGAGVYHRGLLAAAAAAAAAHAPAVGVEGKNAPQHGLRALVDKLGLANAARLLVFALARTGRSPGEAAAADADHGTAAAAQAVDIRAEVVGGPVEAAETATQAGREGGTGGEDSRGSAAGWQPSPPPSASSSGSSFSSPLAFDRDVSLVLMQRLPRRLGMSM